MVCTIFVRLEIRSIRIAPCISPYLPMFPNVYRWRLLGNCDDSYSAYKLRRFLAFLPPFLLKFALFCQKNGGFLRFLGCGGQKFSCPARFWNIFVKESKFFCACNKCTDGGIIVAKGLMRVGFHRINFIVAVMMFVPLAAPVANVCQCGNPGDMLWCAANEHCVERLVQYDIGEYDYVYSCELCPAGREHSATNCYECVVPPCADYTLTCPGYENNPNIKCKIAGYNCDGTGCTKYQACNTVNESTWYLVSAACHFENGTCYENSRDCRWFQSTTENNTLGCDSSSQQGRAQWNFEQSAWDTKNCHCSIVNEVIGNDLFGVPWYCDDLNAEYFVREDNRYVANSVSSRIVYTMERMYCNKCHAGYLPLNAPSPITSGLVYPIYSRPDNNTGWGVVACSTMVEHPHYAEGCTIDFGLTWANLWNACQKDCSNGMLITEDGAVSAAACVPDATIVYEDETGWFTLGTDMDICSQEP